MYHFQQLERLPDFAFQSRFGKLLSAPPQRNQDFINQGRSGEYAARFRGALLRLFGESIAPPGDAVYEYVLKVSETDPAGRSWILTAYEGPSGPAIGGPGTDPS